MHTRRTIGGTQGGVMMGSNHLPGSRLAHYGTTTDKSYGHQYLHLYEGLLEPIRNRATRVLEIGIWDGDSLLMWRDYFRNAEVFGIDVSEAPARLTGEKRIHTIRGDAYSEATLALVDEFGPYDLIVDDGPHTYDSQIDAARRYSELVAPGGLLLIEDIPHIEWVPSITAAVPEHLQRFSYVVDRRWAPGKGDTINDEIIFILDLRYLSAKDIAA